jgi:hypothetical protein
MGEYKNGISPINAADGHIKLAPDTRRPIFEFQGGRRDFSLVLLMMLR